MGGKLLLFLTFLMTLTITPTDLFGQPFGQSSQLSQVFEQVESNEPQLKSLEAVVEQLIRETDQFKSSINLPQANAPELSNITGLSSEEESQVEAIRSQIRLLKKLKQQTNDLLANVPEDRPMQSPAQLPKFEVDMNSQPPEVAQEPPSIRSKDDLSQLVSAQRVLDEPVNLFELGNSLYETGNIPAAFDTFVKVDRSQLSLGDSMWLDYMMASCHRRMSDMENAEAVYRTLANSRDREHIVVAAQGWLKYLQTVRGSRTRITELSTKFDSLMKRAESYDK